jgi:cell division protein FtsW
MGVVLFFVAGGKLKQLAFLVTMSLLIGFLVVKANPYGGDRISSYVPGLKDPLASSDHVQRALSAFAHGGWFGVGLGKGSIKLTILPFPHTDSIFAVVGEEFGVLGAAVVVIMFCLLLWRGLRIAYSAPDFLGTLLASGIAIWIALEAFVNMLALTGLLPFAGNVLPFFSVGGSSLVFTLVGVGILLNVSRQSQRKKLEEERRTFGTTVDLRRRNGRRRVSRSGRS